MDSQTVYKAVEALLQAQPHTIVLSSPRKGAAYKKATLQQTDGAWHTEKLTEKQAFHTHPAGEELMPLLVKLLQKEFTQLTAFDAEYEHGIRLTQKGKVLTRRARIQHPAPVAGAGHNRQKQALLPEGTIIPPLVDMGVFTAEGRVAKAMYGKYRQINRFLELVDDVLKGWEGNRIHVVDFGSGKAYLTFVLYYYLTQVKGLLVSMAGLDLKADVVEKCNRAAQKYGYGGLRFEVGDIENYRPKAPVDMVVTLHACDTATDHALAGAVAWGVPLILSVPCCQHELNAQMQGGSLPILTRYGIVRERAAALFTDALRANLLTACGYKTQLVEFVDFEHTPKNIMIRARKTALPATHRAKALAEAEQLMEAFSFLPTLYTLLKAAGALPEGPTS